MEPEYVLDNARFIAYKIIKMSIARIEYRKHKSICTENHKIQSTNTTTIIMIL
jgi:hypothetical protein